MSSMNNMEIICKDCAESYSLMGNTYPIEIQPTIVLHTLKCPHCQAIIQLWYETGPIIETRRELQKAQNEYIFLKNGDAWDKYQQAKLRFQTVYRTEQEYWKIHMLGISFNAQEKAND